MDTQIITLILLAPLGGALLVALLPDRGKLPAWVALATTLLTLLFALHLPAHFNYSATGFQFQSDIPWLATPNIHYHVGVDGLSLWLVVLTGLLGPVGVLASWNVIRERRKTFYTLFLVQQTAMLGVFVSLDLMLYYGFWELSLIPMAILIAMYGRTQSDPGGPKAALRFFLFTFIPSAPLLVALLWLYAQTRTFDFVTLQSAIASGRIPAGPLCWLSVAFLIAFAVKVPVFPLHGWLTDVFSEAPVALAMVVAGKLGLYSLIRFHVGLFPVQAHQAAPWLLALATIGILYGALLALVQKDFWKLLAYATLSHLSFCVLGIYGFTLAGLDGSVYQILNHGVSAGAIFVLLGALYERFGTSQISVYGGLAKKTPALATLFVITTLSLIGLPILNGFVSEFLILSSTFTGASRFWAISATVGVILGAAYMLLLVQRIFQGPPSDMVAQLGNPDRDYDLEPREHLILWPLAALMLIMGVAPGLWIKGIESGVLPASQTISAPAKIAVSSIPQGGQQ